MWMFGGSWPQGKPSESERRGSDDRGQPGDVVVMISSFIVPPAAEDAFLGWWRLSKPFISAHPGFISARLHRSLDAREGPKYVNVLEWRADSGYREALTKFWTSGPPPIPGVDWRPQLFEIVEKV